MTASFHLAQVNVARMQYPNDGPQMADFMAALDNVNALADRSAGFVWRLQDGAGNATALRLAGDDRVMVNMSTWTDVETLRTFVYKTAHAAVMARRAKWFPDFGSSYMALWWVATGTTPSVEDAAERLASLDARGPSPFAFTFDEPYDASGEPMRLPAIIKDCA